MIAKLTSETVVAPSPPQLDRLPSLVPSVNTRFLLFLGALLITNSHLLKFYPKSFFVGDGLLGYAVFFFVAGIGLTLSARQQLRPFPSFYWRRAIRIYPSLWLVVIPLTIYLGHFNEMSVSDVVYKFIFPTDNTFVGPLMISYIVLYLLLIPRNPKVILIAFILLFIPFIILWPFVHQHGKNIPQFFPGNWLWKIANFQAMLLGSYLAFRLASLRPSSNLINTILLLLTFLVYLTLKACFVKGIYSSLFPLLFFFIFLQFYFLFRLVSSPRFHSLLARIPPVLFLTNLIGACSLEIYFIQDVFVFYTPLYKILFPFNILILWVLLIPLSYLLERVASWIRSGGRKFTWKISPAGGA